MGKSMYSSFLLVFAVMLSLAGITGNEWKYIAPAPTKVEVAKQDQPNVSQTRQIEYQLINRASEVVVGSVHNATAPSPKPLRFYFLSTAYAVEHGIQRSIIQYLSYSKDICCSLASNFIIYPFHYFW